MKTYQEILREGKSILHEATIRLKDETADKINAMGKDKDLKKWARKIAMWGKNDSGLGLARITTVNMLNDFVLKMGKAWEQGKKFDIAKEIERKEFNKVTNPFLEFFRNYVTVLYGKLYDK